MAKKKKLIIRVLGTGSVHTAKRSPTCFLVRADKLYLVDCPGRLWNFIEEHRMPYENTQSLLREINDIIITHSHIDHMGGLEDILFYSVYKRKHKKKKRLKVYTTKLIERQLRQKLEAGICTRWDNNGNIIKKDLNSMVEFVRLNAEKPFTQKGFKIEVRGNWHSTPTIGLKLSYGGVKIGISGDCHFDEAFLKKMWRKGVLSKDKFERLLPKWFEDCDLLFHEVSVENKSHTHTSLANLKKIAKQIPNVPIYVVHTSDDYKGEFPVPLEGQEFVLSKTKKSEINKKV